MLAEPECYIRECKHFQGVKQPYKKEENEFVFCMAFPKGIPEEIAYGHNLHKQPILEQGNDIVYEQEMI